MSKIFSDFRPAELRYGKETYISFYVINPLTNILVRRKIKLNHVKGKTERMKYGRYLVASINKKLYDGWNPFLEELNAKGNASLEQLVAEFLKVKIKDLRKDSMRSYKSFCSYFVKWLKTNGLAEKYCIFFSAEHARNLLKEIYGQEHISSKTYNNYLRFFKTLFNYFIQCDYIKENPFNKFEPKRADIKIRDVIPPSVRTQILNYFVAENMQPYLYIMQLCYQCLIRPKEILMLKIKYIQYEDKMLVIPASVAKNHCERMVGIPDEIMKFFDTLKELDGNLYIFSTNYIPGKKMLCSRDTGKTWSRMRATLQLPMSYQFYSLKDTGITEMLEAGVPAKLVKELADHHSLEMTEKYTHKSSAKKILEYNKLKF